MLSYSMTGAQSCNWLNGVKELLWLLVGLPRHFICANNGFCIDYRLVGLIPIPFTN